MLSALTAVEESPTMLWNLLAVASGVVALFFGGEWLVKGSTRLASRLSVGRAAVGLTVVAFGTSAPELAATLTAAFAGTPEIAYGNVVGSNIANIGLILGAAALLMPMTTTRQFLWVQVPAMLAVTGLGLAFAFDGRFGRVEGAALLAFLAAYLWMTLARGEEYIDDGSERYPLANCLLLVGSGILALTLGARILIFGATGIAEAMGISNRVIGLTVVAVGTSIPELAAALAASAKREFELVLGNVVGSNIFNILAVLGTTSVARPFSFATPTPFEVTALVGFALAMLVLLAPTLRINRAGGLLLLAAYVAYTSLLF